MTPEQLHSKTSLRQHYLEQRAQLPLQVRKEAAARVFDNFFEHIKLPACGIIAGYWPIRSELDDLLILEELMKRGYTCALPRIEEEKVPLAFRAWDTATTMVEGRYGIPEPASSMSLIPDVILVPMTAFDASLHRLGYGGGFYDRTISYVRSVKPAMAIGIAYEDQMCGQLPAGETDIRMDIIVTDKKVYQ